MVMTMKHASSRPLVLSIISIEGGAGKSTTAVNLAWQAWKMAGLKTLLIDLDSNCSLNYFLNTEEHRPLEKTVWSLFQEDFSGELPLISVFDSQAHVCLLPGHEVIDPDLITTRRSREKILKRALPKSQAYTEFDLIILDNRGGIDSIASNSIAAATHLLLGSRVGVKSPVLGKAISKIVKILYELELDPEPDLLGVYLNEMEPSKTHEVVYEGTEKGLSAYEGLVIYPPIPHSGWIAQANTRKVPLGQIRPGDSINETYRQIITDLIKT